MNGEKTCQLFSKAERLRQIIDLWDTAEKHYFFVITKCKSINIFFDHLGTVCFFISNFNSSLIANGRNLRLFSKEYVYNNTWAEYYLQKNTFTWINASSNQYFCAVIYRSCGGLLASEKEDKNSLNDHWNSVTKLATYTYHVGLNYSP